MDKYIGREAAVDAGYLSDWYISSVGDEPPVWTDAHIDELLNDFIVIPKDTKVADVQPVNRWISVKDRLPEKDGNYLCYLECGAVCEAAFDSTIASEGEEFPFGEWVAVYNSDTLGFTDSYWEEYDAITHWMPLPEPPKDGDTNE